MLEADKSLCQISAESNYLIKMQKCWELMIKENEIFAIFIKIKMGIFDNAMKERCRYYDIYTKALCKNVGMEAGI